MCVCFHPEHPALIAGATFNGEVRVWNTSREGEPLIASSGLSDLGHKEPVSQVSGVSVTVCMCGCVCVWVCGCMCVRMFMHD